MDQGMDQRAVVWIKVWIIEQWYGSRYESESSGMDQGMDQRAVVWIKV